MPIGSTLDVVIQQDDLVVLGPPSSIDVAVDIGPRGEAGTQLYSGPLNPNDLTFQEFQDIYGDIPRLRDLFLRTDEGPNYGSFYQFTNVPGNDQWEIVVDLIDAIELFFDLNPDFILQPKSGGTGVNNGTNTITVGGNFRTLGNFPLDFGLSGSTVLALPTSGSVAVWQDKLNRFAPTTSAELASVITDETGTGQLVFNTSPNISTSITTNSPSFNLINTNVTTANIAGAGTNITIGANGTGTLNLRNATVDMTGDLIVRGSDIIAAESVFNLVDTVATTVNFARAATTVNIGQTTGNTNVRNNLNVTGDVAVAGGDITTTAGTFNLINTNATTVNLAGAASAVNIGAGTSLTTINDDLTVLGDAIISGNLLVSGSATIIDVEKIVVEDPVITLGGENPPLAPDNKDRGLEFRWHDGVSAKVGFFGFDDATQNFKFIPDGTNTDEVFSGPLGNLDIYDITANDIAVNGGNITTTASAFNLVNASATTINFAGDATSLFIGATTGLTTIRNDVLVSASHLTTLDGIEFADTPGITDGERKLLWNDDDGTLDLGLKGGNVTLQIGQEFVARVFNDSGVTLNDGDIVIINGAQGQRVSVDLADASSNAYAAAHAFGVVTETILAGEEGYVTTQGTVRGLNTFIDGSSEGVEIFLSPTTPGAWTTTRPLAPNHAVRIGWIQREHAAAGSIYVNIQVGEHLEFLHDVLIPSPQDNDLLVYNSSSAIWVNNDISDIINSASSITMQDLFVSGSAVVDGDITVNGASAYLNVDELLIEDHLITLGFGTTGTPSETGGIEVARGDESTVSIIWNEIVDKWQFTNDGTNYLDLGSGSGTGEETFLNNFLTMGA